MASLRHQSGPASLFETTPGGGLDLDSLTPSAQANTTSTIDAIADVSAIANAPAAASEVLPTSASSPHQRDLGPTTASLNGDLGRNSEEEPITSPRASPSTNNINTLAAAAGGIHHASLPHHNNDPAAAVAVPSPGAESIRITTTPHSHTAGTTTSSSPPPTFTPPPPPVNSTSTSTSETSTSGLAATGIRTPSPETIPMPVPFPFSSASRHHSSSSSNLLAHPVPSSSSSHPSPYYHNTSHQPQQQNEPLQIILTSDRLICRGVAGNLEPALLSGHVVLNLTEATNIKDISLNLVGKARIPTGEKASSQSSINPIIFSHHWSFLPENGGHKHTIKEGRHIFPFQLEIPASLPASMASPAVGAEVYYKLRATAVRSSTFAPNFNVVKPVFVIKAFSYESLEYNQSLEVENTWPGKIMYSIMIPHKAYAAGDAIPAVLRFTPTAKGVSVLSVGMELAEYVHVRWPRVVMSDASANSTRTVTAEKFGIKDGKAVRPFSSTSSTAAATSVEPNSAAVAGPSTMPGLGEPYGSGAGTSTGSGTVTPPAHSDGLGAAKKFGQSSRSTSFKNLMNLVGGSSSNSSHHPHHHNHHHGPIAADLSLSAVSSTSPSSSRGPSRVPSSNALSSFMGGGGVASGSRTPLHGGLAGGAGLQGSSGATSPRDTPGSSRRPSHEDVRVGNGESSSPAPTDHATSGSNTNTNTHIDVEVPASGDDEINTRVSLKIPLSTVPSHSSSISVASNGSSSSPSDRPYPLPLSVSHKVRFSVLLSNLDGHTSELRCALPVHILDGRLLKEARAATRVTRDVLLGRRRRPRRGRPGRVQVSPEQLGDAAPFPAVGDIGLDGVDDVDLDYHHPHGDDDDFDPERDGEEDEEDEDDSDDDEAPIELPSYTSHVHDRVANAEIDYSSASAVNYAPNSLASTPATSLPASISSLSPAGAAGGYFALTPNISSNGATPGVPDWQHRSLPASPPAGIINPSSTTEATNANGGTQPLAFDEELMLSLGQVAASRGTSSSSTSAPLMSTSATSQSRVGSLWMSKGPGSISGSGSGTNLNQSHSNPTSRTGRSGFWSGGSSRSHSRANSRAPSPEPRSSADHHHNHSDSHSATSSSTTSLGGVSASSGTASGSGAAAGGGKGLFHIPSSLKPLSALSSLRPHHSNMGANNSSTRGSRSRPSSPTPDARARMAQPPGPAHRDDISMLNRVPSYGIASRGFLGGGAPPLQLYRDLPTYDEAESARTSPVITPGSGSAGSRSRGSPHPGSSPGGGGSTGTSPGPAHGPLAGQQLSPNIGGMNRSQSEMSLADFRRRAGG